MIGGSGGLAPATKWKIKLKKWKYYNIIISFTNIDEGVSIRSSCTYTSS